MTHPESDTLQKVKQKLALHDAAMESTSCGISISDARKPDMPLIYVNEAFTEMSGYSKEEVLGKNCRFLQGDDREQEARKVIREALNTGSDCTVLLRNYHKDGSFFWNELIISPIRNDDGVVTHFVGVQNDVTEREEARRETEKKKLELEETLQTLKETQAMLVHSEKMNAMGQMVAGVAHEINNPIAFVSSNIHALQEMTNDLKEAFAELHNAVKKSDNEHLKSKAQELYEAADFDFIVEDLDDLLSSSSEGLKRVKNIVSSLRNFSRLDEAEVKQASIKECITSTIDIAGAVTKNKLHIQFELDDLPSIKCRPSQLNQVFLNLIMNAAQAMETEGELKIHGEETEQELILTFSDTGKGMDQETQQKIFNPFFTTKPVGEGTGLGLSIAYKIITDGHNGNLTVESEPGKGSTFTIRLPKNL